MSDKDKFDPSYWIEDLDDDIPIIPTGSKKASDEVNYASQGWKFYVKLKSQLSELWLEFNNTIGKSGRRPKYATVRDFAKVKFKNKEERNMFVLMTCSKREWEVCASNGSIKKTVPWLGDWVKRRKNGYWMEDNSYQISNLKKVIKENLESAAAIKATAPFIIQELLRYNKLQAKVEELYGGNPLSDDPRDKKNKEKFKDYLDMISSVTALKVKLIREWMRIHGVSPETPNEMWSMAQLAQGFAQAGAAGALTGMVASQGLMLQNPEGAPTVLSRDALLLADHLTSHKELFKDAPMVIDATLVEDKEERKEKANGKHTQ